MELLENKPDFDIANPCQVSICQLRHINAIQVVTSRCRSVKTANNMHRRRLTRPRSTHNRAILSLLNNQAHPIQSANFCVTHTVDFEDILKANNNRFVLRIEDTRLRTELIYHD